MDILAFPVDKL